MKYFKLSEFDCGCGCGLNNISRQVLDMLEDAREEAGVPFIVTSASRCQSHNKKVGGSPSSSHLLGLAVDISANNSAYRIKIVESLINVGFGRIGIAKNFIHVDVDESKPQNVMWIYR